MLTGCFGKDFLPGVAADMKFMEMARNSCHGCRAVSTQGRCFGILRAIAADQIRGSDPDRSTAHRQMRQPGCGNLEGRASGGARCARARCATRCSRRDGRHARRTARHLGGEAALPRLCRHNRASSHRSPAQPRRLGKITKLFGRDWIFLETLYRIYRPPLTSPYRRDGAAVRSTPQKRHRTNIERWVNWLKPNTRARPSEAAASTPPRPGAQYFTALWRVTEYPLLRAGTRPGETDANPRPDAPD